MARSAPARRRTMALLLAGPVASVLLLGPGAGPAAGAPAQIDCVVNPNAPECQEQPTTTLAPTTTEPEPVDPSPTTTSAPTTTEPASLAPTVTTSPPATARPVPTTAAPVQTTTEPATTLTTQANLLVPGDGTQGAESTTTTLRTETRVQGGSGPSDGTLIALIIGGLVVVAVLVAILTFRYWRATAPIAAGRAGATARGEATGADPGPEVTTRTSPAGVVPGTRGP